jgi:hypothetical protein
MAIKSILTSQEDFTGEFPVTSRTSALWRFNEKTPDENLQLMDSSGHGRHFTISGWSGTNKPKFKAARCPQYPLTVNRF